MTGLSWVDYDSAAHQRSQRILTLFSERETRDELGLGAVRDSISDTLFPGTSTIHTRLRYFLFIPWIYRQQEGRGVGSSRIVRSSRAAEVGLIEALLKHTPDGEGIIGRDARQSLARLPSAVYWAALGLWNLRLFPGTQGQYHRSLDLIYKRRRGTASRRSSALDEGDDIGGLWDLGALTWHPGMPDAPAGFPEGIDFRLTREEAAYLREQIKHSHPGSLLAHLVMHPEVTTIDAPWQHPDWASFDTNHQALLQYGHNFSLISHGAALIYNLLLAERRGDDELIERYRDQGRDWLIRFKARSDELRSWHSEMHTFWSTVDHPVHKVNSGTVRFVEQWVALALQRQDGVFDDPDARALVRAREIEKKKGHSRFTNPRMLEQWSGRSNLVEMTYRWNIVQSYIADFATALKSGRQRTRK